MTTLYHGRHSTRFGSSAHEGICLTDSDAVAQHYAGSTGIMYEIEIDMESMVVEDCEGYDRDSNETPADSAEYRSAAAVRGIDVLRYEDEDEFGRSHGCYRLVSERAVAACVMSELV